MRRHSVAWALFKTICVVAPCRAHKKARAVMPALFLFLFSVFCFVFSYFYFLFAFLYFLFYLLLTP